MAEGKPSGIERTKVGVPTDSVVTKPIGEDAEKPISGVEPTVAQAPPISEPPISGIEPTIAGGGIDLPPDEQLTVVTRAHYEFKEELARGGMGRILIARDRRIGRTVALKELLGSGDAVRFEREALVTGRLQHPAIVPVYEAGRWPTGEPFFAMKLVKGRSLDKVIAEKTHLNQRLALLPTIIQIAEAMAYAHSEHVIHRDLKPQNVLVGDYGETVVVDWGLAKDLGDQETVDPVSLTPYRSPASSQNLTMVGSVMGTPTYMPVEQARGKRLDERADVYALGAILYHVLAGHPPYSGKTADEILDRVNEGPPRPLATVAAGVPEELAAIVDKAMARSVDDRYRTAKQLADELVRFQAGQLVAAHRYSRWALIKRFARRHRAALSAAAALLVIGGVIAIISVRQVVSARDDARAALITVEHEKRAFLVEEGRQELAAARNTKAATLLGEAYASGAPDDYTRWLLAHAMRPLDAAIARIETGAISDLGVLANDRFVVYHDASDIEVWTLDGTALGKFDGRGSSLAVSQDGTLMAFFVDTRIDVIDARTLKKVASLEGGGEIETIAFAPDGKRVYAIGGQVNAELLAWTLDGKLAGKLALADGRDTISSIAVLANGVVFAQTQEDGLRLIAADLSKAVKMPGETVRASADGSHVAFGMVQDIGGDTSRSISLFAALDLANPVATIPHAAVELVIDRTGTRILQLPGTEDAVLYGRRPDPIARVGGVRAALSPDGKHVATTDDNQVIRIYDERGEVIAVWPGHQREIKVLAFSPDGRTLVSGGEDGVRTWRLQAPDMRRLAATAIGDAAGSPDGRQLVAIRDSKAVIFDAATGAVVRELDQGGRLWNASFSPDGTRVVTTNDLGALAVWDVASGSVRARANVFAWSARFSPDGTRVITAGDVDGHVFDAATGADTPLPGADLVMAARFSADGALAITAAQDGVARIYDATSGALVVALRGHTDYLVDAAFDSTGTRAITASGDRTARLWDVRTGATIATLSHPSAVAAAVISPAGDRILTIARDGGRVWDARTTHQVAALGGTTDPVLGGKFLRGGNAIATFTKHAALIWETTRGAPLFTLPPRSPPSRTVTFLQIDAPNLGPDLVDPRRRVSELVELAGDRIAFSRPGHVTIHDLGREQRTPAEIAAVIAKRGDWRIVEGSVVPSRDLVERRVDDRPIQLDFSEEAISGSTQRPDHKVGVVAGGTAIGSRIHQAAVAHAGRAKAAEVHTLLAGVPETPPVTHEEMYELAWLRHDLGDHTAAFSAMRAAAADPRWRPTVHRTIVRELALFAAYAEASFDDTVSAIRAAARNMDRAEMLHVLDEVYRDSGDLALEQRALAELAPMAPPRLLARVRQRQAHHAFFAGDTRAVRLHGIAALDAAVTPSVAAKVRDEVFDGVIELAARAARYHEQTRDEGYLRAAHSILKSALAKLPADDPRRKAVGDSFTQVEQRISGGVMTSGSYRQEHIREAVRSRSARIRRCYERALVVDPTAAGKIMFALTIAGGKSTKVKITSRTLKDPAVATCIADELRTLTFPRALYAGVVEANYPFTFRPVEE